jgi:cation diffusion facilitator family transporter
MKNNHDNYDTSKHVIQSLIVNLLIVIAKAFAAFMTKSGAMLAETIHSFADCTNQVLLLLGIKQAKKPADANHPFGYGMSVYFWSFMVAMLLFTIGGMFSIYEGIHKYNHPEPVEQIGWGVTILLFSISLEGYAAYSNVVELKKRKGNQNFFSYLRSTKESDLIVVFGENSAAVFGLILALIALLASYYTGDGRYDAMGSLAIGLVLILVAIFLSIEVKSLLIGESADPIVSEAINKLIDENQNVEILLSCRTVQQGPGEVLVCMRVKCNSEMNTVGISNLINDFEAQLKIIRPEVKWIYIEPDMM